MPRPKTRTSQLLRDDLTKIRDVFGTTRNAFRCLALEGLVPFGSFSRALQWLPVKPDEADVIEERWDEWCATFLAIPIAKISGFRLGDPVAP